MFERILVANRGEIACRVIRGARACGVSAVAVHSEADADALHVELADSAVCIGGPAPADSYLRGDRIVAAALETGAEAIHPGYGFLSENPEFVEAVESAGLVFVGPSASAIRAMGLKDAARQLMSDAGVPVVPGYHGENQDAGHLAERAAEIGFPVLIKAVAGGGGKGMRLVERAEEFGEALERARGEARAAFGNDAVLVEKFVTAPRHVEFQIFGDGERVVHLRERDCSLQRRYQKVIEEAPAPGMTEETRAAMGAAAVRAGEAVGYRGAGTVEFIADGSEGLRPDRFWFMEMNTRLQVEHPVTEATTGIDLVEWQLRVASGEPLPATQDEIAAEGHAIEARLYAEDVERDFLPAAGTLTHLSFPEGARIDSGVRAGDEITPWYDPMIAKVTVWAPNRATAIRRLDAALARTEVAGIATNAGFLRRLASQEDFVAGRLETGLIARNLDTLVAVAEPGGDEVCLAALAALDLLEPPGPDAGFALWKPLCRTVGLEWREERIEVGVAVSGKGRIEIVGEGWRRIAVWRDGAWWVGEDFASAAESGFRRTRQDAESPGTETGVGAAGQAGSVATSERARRVGGASLRVARRGGKIAVFGDSRHEFDVPESLAAEGLAGGGAETGLVVAPMPGLVKRIDARPGARVASGERLAVLEAMKMEHALVAPREGIVAEVLAAEGAQVEGGATLLRLEPESDGAGSNGEADGE